MEEPNRLHQEGRRNKIVSVNCTKYLPACGRQTKYKVGIRIKTINHPSLRKMLNAFLMSNSQCRVANVEVRICIRI